MNQEQDQDQPQTESKASDSVRIAEPVATSGAVPEPDQLADDMIEGVSARSVAISARPVMEDITSRAISSPTGSAIPHDVAIDTSDGSQRASVEQLTGGLGNPTHDSVDSVRIAESDSEDARQC